MTYRLNLFSPDTARAFEKHGKTISGFSRRQAKTAARIRPGDRLLCYVTKISRWIGILEVVDGPFEDDTPIFEPENDRFVVRFKVNPIVWLTLERAIPIHEDVLWNNLSFTKDHEKSSVSWTGKVRSSLTEISDQDGRLIEELLKQQADTPTEYPLDETDQRKIKTHTVKTGNNADIQVSIPDEEPESEAEVAEAPANSVRESIRVQAQLARIGASMGYRIWIPRSDRSRVDSVWTTENPVEVLEQLPLNYDDTTLSTIEQIDVIWLRNRSIVRVFEVEHTTSIYSGILRMADLMALQPNLDIKAHIVAPYERREKVLQELRRPVFSLLEKGPLATYCSYIDYADIDNLMNQKFISHMTDSVLDEVAEFSDSLG